ncbi:MAG: hypothetical protein ACLTV6_05765 [Christensenellales bacterium]
MFAHRSHRQVEMTAGPLLPNVLAFTVPLILSGVLQLLYNSADIIVVGRFAIPSRWPPSARRPRLFSFWSACWMG